MRVAGILPDIGLVNVVSPDRIERRNVAGHARHEASNQRRQAKPENAGWEVIQEQHRDRQVVVEFRLAVLVVLDLSARLHKFVWNQTGVLRARRVSRWDGHSDQSEKDNENG